MMEIWIDVWWDLDKKKEVSKREVTRLTKTVRYMGDGWGVEMERYERKR